VLAVMLGVMLAGLPGMMGGMRRMAVRGMSVVRRLLVAVGVVVLGGLAMMLGGMLVMLGSGVVMLDDLVLGHRSLRRLNVAPFIGTTPSTLGTRRCSRVTPTLDEIDALRR